MLEDMGEADAYGACFEYSDPDGMRRNDLSGYPPNLAYPAIGRGRYTDDTQRAIAVAETILAGRISVEAFADALVRCYRRDPRAGYSRFLETAMPSFSDGAALRAGINIRSTRSGAAMGAGPIGLLPDIGQVMAAAAIQATVTHDTPEGVESAQACALMVHALHYGCCRREVLPFWVDARLCSDWTRPWSGPVGPEGKDAVRAALWMVARHGGSRARLLQECVALTGDVDTVATIALGAASSDSEAARDIPPALHDGLEQGEFGRDFLVDLDKRLAAVFPRPNTLS